jgi:hypothetical protein
LRIGRLTLLMIVIAAAAAQAQSPGREPPDSFLNQQRAADELARRRFDDELRGTQRVSFDVGGWYSLYFFQFDDGVESSRVLRRHDLRLWGRASFDDGAHEFYARVRTSLLDFNHGDSYDGNEDDVEGPNLERGYYRFDLGRSDAGATLPAGVNLTVKLGRDLATVGHGVTLAQDLDHALITLDLPDWRFTGLAGRTVGSSEDFDLSRNATRSRRSFLGAEVSYRGIDRHEPFAYFLAQRDHNSERPPVLFQEFDYDSNYVGLGSGGELMPGLRYAVEGVYEWGHSYGDRRWRRDNRVDAWAATAELEYLFPGPRQTRASIEYLFGSGDPERTLSPTNSAGGNRGDLTDNSFIGFGFRDTGLSFAPRYSNLHMWRAGGSFRPFPDDAGLRELELGTDWFLYHKNQREGAVSDPTADLANGYLGWEMDYYANWATARDLFWTARLGVFFPGDAFSDRTTRTFLMLGVTWSF